MNIKTAVHDTFQNRAIEAESSLEKLVDEICADAINEEKSIAIEKESVDAKR